MNVEEQLREYRTVLDAAAEDAATGPARAVAPVIRMRPVRTLVVAAVAVAAAIAIAFAVVGTTGKRSTTPAGATTTPPPSSTTRAVHAVRVPNVIGVTETEAIPELQRAGFVVVEQPVHSQIVPAHLVVAESPVAGSSVARGTEVTLAVSNGPGRGATTEAVPVTVCPTQQGTTNPGDPHAPSSITIASPTFDQPTLAAYSGTRGYLIVTAPAGWGCRAVEATDGGQAIGVTPPGATPRDGWGTPGHVTTPLTDGVFAASEDACQGCIHGEICGIVPTASVDFPDDKSLPCPRPHGETVLDRGNGVYEFDDPAGTVGPSAARSILRYVRATAHTNASVVRETCILAASQSSVCDELFAEFLALQPTPWNQPQLTISPTSLGAVQIGMSLSSAQEAAGETFASHNYSDLWSSPDHDRTGLELFAALGGGEKVFCVGAELVVAKQSPTQRVVTPEGFALGGTVQQLLAVYKNAEYIPAPTVGATRWAGYRVRERGGVLTFAVNQNKVFQIAGGTGVNLAPSTCTP